MTYIDPLDPLQRSRLPYLFLQYGSLEVVNGAFVLVDAQGVRIQIPIGSISVLYLEPGVTLTHAAAMLAAHSRTLLVWVGEGGTRTYSVGLPATGDTGRLLVQVQCHQAPAKQLEVVYRMYRIRFHEGVPSRRSLEQLRGIEGARVRAMYQNLARLYRVPWTGRKYDSKDWDSADLANRAISAATSCMHGLCEAVLVACGYSPALGFLHTGAPRSFVFDIADLYKMEICIPVAFELASKQCANIEGEVRHRLRDEFRKSQIIDRIVRDTDSLFEGLGQ